VVQVFSSKQLHDANKFKQKILITLASAIAQNNLLFYGDSLIK